MEHIKDPRERAELLQRQSRVATSSKKFRMSLRDGESSKFSLWHPSNSILSHTPTRSGVFASPHASSARSTTMPSPRDSSQVEFGAKERRIPPYRGSTFRSGKR